MRSVMVKFSVCPPLDSLVDLACRDGVDIRPTLLRVLTDLYVQKPTHSDDEETQYVELALGLIEAADESTRMALKARLEAYPAAPAAVLRKLGSTRPDGLQVRSDAQELVETFLAARPDERRLILTNLEAGTTSPARHPSPITSEVIRRLEAAALRRNSGEFSRILERALGISRTLAKRITQDPSGEPIVVAARALGMKAAVLQRILLFLNSAIGESVRRVYDLANLFDELTPDAADHMVAIWRQATAPPQSTHAPRHWDNQNRSARSLVTAAAHRTIQRQGTVGSQVKTGNQ